MLSEYVANGRRDFAHVIERHIRLRVEVDAQLVGMIDIVATHRPRIQVDTTQVRCPYDVCDIDRTQLFSAATAWKVHRHGFYPWRTLLWHTLLEEWLALRTIGKALQH